MLTANLKWAWVSLEFLFHLPDLVAVVQSLSYVQFFATPWTAACWAPLSFTRLMEFAQTHDYWVGDAIQPFQPLFSPSPSAFSLSQYQGLFQGIGSLYQMVKLLEFQLQHQSFQWIFSIDFPLGLTGLFKLLSSLVSWSTLNEFDIT